MNSQYSKCTETLSPNVTLSRIEPDIHEQDAAGCCWQLCCELRDEGRAAVHQQWAALCNCMCRQVIFTAGGFVETKMAEGETEPGKKVDAASGHSVIQPTFIGDVLYAGYPSRHWGHRSGETFTVFMVTVFVGKPDIHDE